MEHISVNWNEEQFKAYLMIYAANSNFYESEEEKELILSKVNPDIFKTMHREYDHDNDYQSLQKILYCINKFGYSEEEINNLEKDIKAVLLADGKNEEVERNMFLGLHRLLH